MKLFLVLNRISHSFALFTREISGRSTLEINFIFPHIHVLFSISKSISIRSKVYTGN